MRGDEAEVADPALMSDMIAAPEDHAIADHHAMLDHVVLEDEDVFAKLCGAPTKPANSTSLREAMPPSRGRSRRSARAPGSATSR